MTVRRPKRRRRAIVPVPRVKEIAELAEAVADEHCPDGLISPREIASSKGITLSFGKYGATFDGMLEWKNGRFHIFCNLDRVKESDSPRARFTMGHELGHYFIDEHRHALQEGLAPAHRSNCLFESRNHVEQEADHFATNLLMPRERFVKRAKRCEKGLAGILKLADHFKTSVTGTAVRYASLDVTPCAVVKWNWKGYSWKRLSSQTFEARFCRTIELPQQLVENSPTWRILNRQTPEKGDFFSACTTASAWFPKVKTYDFRNVLLIEEALSLGRYGVLTFLYPESGTWEPAAVDKLTCK